MLPIILASSSKYRRQLLQRLELPFSSQSPNIDESPIADEAADTLALRLAKQKAEAVASSHPGHLIIASDQTASIDKRILGKPGSYNNAVKQLTQCSGHKVTFYTSLCLYNSSNKQSQVDLIPYSVYFRDLASEQIERYLRKEQPYDCAGSFKMEGLGITLFKKMEGDDPNSLIGLPLIRLVDMLGNEGIQIP